MNYSVQSLRVGLHPYLYFAVQIYFNSYVPEIYINDREGNELKSDSEEVKILGFIFDRSPTVEAQVKNIIGKTRRRYWVLRHLRRFGLSEQELLDVYKSVVRSVIEFSAVVYHSMLTIEQSKSLERLQMQSLKCIYGVQYSYRKLLEITGLETLEERRIQACDNFARKCLDSRFSHWFPRRERREGLRRGKTFKEEYARTNRMKNTPIYYMRRRLNYLAETNPDTENE